MTESGSLRPPIVFFYLYHCDETFVEFKLKCFEAKCLRAKLYI